MARVKMLAKKSTSTQPTKKSLTKKATRKDAPAKGGMKRTYIFS